MKNIFLFLLFALATTAFSQEMTIAPSGKKFIITYTTKRDNGRIGIEIGNPIDSTRARAELSNFVAGLNQRIAELNLELARLTAEKAKAENSFFTIDGSTIEDDLTTKLSGQFIGKYLFTRSGVQDTLTISAKALGKPNERLLTKLSSSTSKGTLKIESGGVATILSTFRDSKNKLFDAKLTLVDNDIWVSDLDGEKVFFQKLPPEKTAKKL